MPRGAKPGERRGGRKKGVKNKLTLEKLRLLKESADSAGGKLAMDNLAKLMGKCVALAERYEPFVGEEPDEVAFVRFVRLSSNLARALAPYQSPTFTRLQVSGDKNNPLLVGEGVTPSRLREILLEKIIQTGLIPTALKQLEGGNGIANIIDAEIVSSIDETQEAKDDER